MKERFCSWHCGRKTQNRSGICDLCWVDRELIYRARKAIEAAEALKPKEISAAKRASMTTARRAKLLKEMPQSGGSNTRLEEMAT